MQRQSTKGATAKDSKGIKNHANSSKNKKQFRQSSSKNLKLVKGIGSKGHLHTQQSKIKQSTSPDMTDRNRQIDNDYGVNPYYAKYKVKTSHKKEAEQIIENTDYGTVNSSKDTLNISHFDNKHQKGSKIKVEESDYAETAFQKIKLPNPRGVINAEGKFVPNNRSKEPKNQSFHHNSGSKNSFSLNFNSRQESRYRKKTNKSKSKSKSKKKIFEEQKQEEYRIKFKSADKTHSRDYHHSYYEKSRQQPKEKAQKKEKKIKPKKSQEYDKIASINSKTTSVGTETEVYSVLCLTQDTIFVQKIKDQIIQELKPTYSIKKSRFSDSVLRQRNKALTMISKICGAFSMKRQIFFLTLHYLDSFINHFPYQSMKLIALGSLTLALKMEDAQMISKFCYHYLYNPEKTVKKSGSNNHIKIKNKKQSAVAKEQGKEVRSKLSGCLNVKISQEKKAKEDFSLEQILDCQTHIMMKFGFKLVTKTLSYWVDMLTALWDSYVGQFCPKYLDTLIFRNDKAPRNLSYIVQMVQLETISMGAYGFSKVSLVLAAIYLVVRMFLQEKKEQTPWQQLCRYYRVSLSKTTNLIFCDGIGINVLFGDFLTLFELSMSNIIDCIQIFSKYLQPQMLKVFDYRKIQGLNREDRMTIHVFCEQLYKYHSI